MPKFEPSEMDRNQRQKIVEFLKSHPVGVLACVDTEGNPHASAVYFSTDENLQVSFTTKRETFKYTNIMRHDTVMLVVLDAQSQTSVQISGHACLVTDEQAGRAIYQNTIAAAGSTGDDNVPPIAKITAGQNVAFTIQPDYVKLSEYGWGDNFVHAMEHADDPNISGDPS